ncbi:hypothetical protein RRG08_047845 [Elysia crispata]|uniref:Serpin domain-containing protein n=1 Tax=Elysia crispata TaxID=231223 RepID=A0AAE1DP93_9GAST|nr:hypothetical protein RRG08_047845 [Elysia crispata]
MASWKLSAALLLCILVVLIAQADSQRPGRRNRNRQRNRNRNQVATSGSDGDGGDGQGVSNNGRPWRRWRGNTDNANNSGAGTGQRRGNGGRRRGRQQGGGQGRRRGNNGRRGGRRGGRGGRGGRSGRGGARTVDPVLLVNGLSNSTGAFSWDLYRRMASSNTDNFVFSPLSVYAAMGMLLLGSQGRTKTQLISGLNVSSPIHSGFSHYNLSLARDEDSVGPRFSIANKLYHKQDFSYLPRYQRKVRRFYKSEIEEFQEEFPEEAVNDWVEEQTEGMIPDFLEDGSITEDTILMLVNAIYFQANWSAPFEASMTSLRPFMVNNSITVQVETMAKTGYFRKMHHPSLLATSLEMPYTGGRFSLFILLPDEGVALSSLETVLDAQVLNTTLSMTVPQSNIYLEIPKFSLDTEEDMKERLQELGINSIFNASSCRLRRMTTARNVAVSEVKHRAVMQVDEKGTTAAAATSIGIVLTSAGFAPTEFKVNRPFLFVLRDKEHNINLFMGRYVNPQGDNIDEYIE